MEIYSNIDKTSVTTCAFALETYQLYKRKSKLQDPVIKGSNLVTIGIVMNEI